MSSGGQPVGELGVGACQTNSDQQQVATFRASLLKDYIPQVEICSFIIHMACPSILMSFIHCFTII